MDSNQIVSMMKRKEMSKKRAGLLFFSLLVLAAAVFAADAAANVDKIFSQEQRLNEYREVYHPLKSLFTELEGQGYPVENLLDKLREGLAKRVSPEALLTGIRDEAQRIKQASALLNKIQVTYSSDAEKTELYRNISLFLLGGLKLELLEQMLVGAKAKKEAAKVFQSLGTTVLKLKTVTSLTDQDLATLTNVLLASTLNYSSYPMITSLFVKAKMRRVSEQEMFSLVVNILNNGGGVLQIEEELSRRSKR